MLYFIITFPDLSFIVYDKKLQEVCQKTIGEKIDVKAEPSQHQIGTARYKSIFNFTTLPIRNFAIFIHIPALINAISLLFIIHQSESVDINIIFTSGITLIPLYSYYIIQEQLALVSHNLAV